MNNKTVVLNWQNISQSFGTVQALKGFNAQVMKGSITALLGVNGAGKSTLIDITMGINKPSTGTATVYGLKPEQAVLKGLVGCMLQGSELPSSLTCKQLLTTLNNAINNVANIENLLEITQLQTLANRKIAKLSGGEKQRIRLAIALLNNPPLLIMDEPTTGLDVNARAEFWKLMQNLADQGRTILFATHYLAEAQAYADQVLVINQGKLILDGSVAQIRAQAEAHLSFTLSPQLQPELLTQIKPLTETKGITISADGELVNITGAGLDEILKYVTAFRGTANYQLVPASLEEAFTKIVKESSNE